MNRKWIQSASVAIDPNGNLGVTLAGPCVAQGEKAVGNGTVPLSDTSIPCRRVWIGAPTAEHTKAAVNTGVILVGKGATTALNKSGGMVLKADNAEGFYYHTDDATNVYLTGFAAGDAVEYQVFA